MSLANEPYNEPTATHIRWYRVAVVSSKSVYLCCYQALFDHLHWLSFSVNFSGYLPSQSLREGHISKDAYPLVLLDHLVPDTKNQPIPLMEIFQHTYPFDASCLQQATACISFGGNRVFISLFKASITGYLSFALKWAANTYLCMDLPAAKKLTLALGGSLHQTAFSMFTF